MFKKYMSILAITKYIMALMVLGTIVVTSIKEQAIVEDFWKILTFMLTSIFGGMVHFFLIKEGKPNIFSEVGQSIIAIVILGLVCYLTIVEKTISSALWQGVMIVLTFVFVGRANPNSGSG